MSSAPLSVIIPTLNAADGLPATLAGLWHANEDGLIREVVVSDGGSQDGTLDIADELGCRVVTGAPGRGGQQRRGAAAARGPWLLFLHADTQLRGGWEQAIWRMTTGNEIRRAGVFRHAFDHGGMAARTVSFGANLRTRIFALPYGDQGLVISKAHYDALEGHADHPLFEDVDLMRRLVRRDGRGALLVLNGEAVTSPVRYERAGYAARVIRNQHCLWRYWRGDDPAAIAAAYAGVKR